MNPKDIVYKMVVLGRRLTTHFILDIFWGSSFMFHVVLGFWLLVRARVTQVIQVRRLGSQAPSYLNYLCQH